MTESTLDRAQAGSEQAFRELVDPYRGELHVHCYRMMGSLVDAEDMLQETLLAAWRGVAGFAGRSSIRTWLHRIATNRCLNAIRDSRRRIPTVPVPPFDPPQPSRHSEVTWLQPYPDAVLGLVADREPGPAERSLSRETVELAFVTALQQLPPRQAAVLLLIDVLEFSAREVAPMLDATTTAVKGLLQRARASVARRAPPVSRPPAGPSQERDLARRFAHAFSHDDLDGIVALLTDDAWLAMPPAPHAYDGPAAVRDFLEASVTWRSGRPFALVPTIANTQPAFGCYLADHRGIAADFTGILVLTVRDDLISGVTRFLDPDLAEAFGMPRSRSCRRRSA